MVADFSYVTRLQGRSMGDGSSEDDKAFWDTGGNVPTML